jgi:hypothetical protein
MALDTGELPADEWPPRTVDLKSGDWVTAGEATGIVPVTERTIWRWVKEYPTLSIKFAGRRYLSRAKLASLHVSARQTT